MTPILDTCSIYFFYGSPTRNFEKQNSEVENPVEIRRIHGTISFFLLHIDICARNVYLSKCFKIWIFFRFLLIFFYKLLDLQSGLSKSRLFVTNEARDRNSAKKSEVLRLRKVMSGILLDILSLDSYKS